MNDYLYRYFGGKNLYTAEEWEQIINEKYNIVEVDAETGTETILRTNESYNAAFDSLTTFGLKDFDFEIHMVNSATKKLLAKKSWSDKAAGGCIKVCR